MRVFVSHSSADKDFCDLLVHALRQADADVWYDEHNLGAGQLMDDIMRELRARPVFVVVLSKAAFASSWVHNECTWAFNLHGRERDRIILPVVAAPLDRGDFDAMLFLEVFKRISGPNHQPYPRAETIARTLRLLKLTPPGEAPVPTAPEPGESAGDLLAHGKALSAQNRFTEAIPYFERATQLAPRSFDAWANLGRAYGETNRYHDELAACDRSLALDDKQSWVWNNKGVALNGLRRWEEALAAYDRALALDPNIAYTWHNKGNVHNVLGRSEEALADYDRALALDPNVAQTWRNKGFALDVLGRHAEALTAYDRARQLGE